MTFKGWTGASRGVSQSLLRCDPIPLTFVSSWGVWIGLVGARRRDPTEPNRGGAAFVVGLCQELRSLKRTQNVQTNSGSEIEPSLVSMRQHVRDLPTPGSG